MWLGLSLLKFFCVLLFGIGSQTFYIKTFACFFGFLWKLGIYITEKCFEQNR
jgi:hypothetical protein